MVFVADRVVAATSGPFLLDDPSTEVSDSALDALRLTREKLTEVLAAMPSAIADAQRVFGAA